jgi:hypothetical protein
MKTTIQIQIVVIPIGIAVYGPYNEKNNTEYKSLGGRYDHKGRRWILPNNKDSWRKLDELFGEESPSAIIVILPGILTAYSGQLQFGGYVIATWNAHKGCVRMAEGVEVIGGEWDEAASAAHFEPRLSSPDAVLHVVIRRSMAQKHGLVIIEELKNEPLQNPLMVFADSDLQVELEGRGYKVERSVFF